MRKLRTRGISIVEVMASVGILAIALVGVLAAVSSTMRMNEDSHDRVIAIEAARQKMEEIQAREFGYVRTYNGVGFAVTGLTAQNGDADGLPGEVLIDETTGTNTSQYLEVQVSVRWKTLTGPRSVELRRKLTDERGGSGWGEPVDYDNANGADDPAEESAGSGW